MSQNKKLFIVGCLISLIINGCSSPTPTTAAPTATTAATVAPAATATTPATATPVPTATTSLTMTPYPIIPPHTPSATSAFKAGQTRTDAKGIEQVWVPAGTFLMGTSATNLPKVPEGRFGAALAKELESELPQHEVAITYGYWIDKYEITNEAFQKFVDDGGYKKREYWSSNGLAWLSTQNPSSSLVTVAGCGGDPQMPKVCITWYEAEAYALWRGGRLPTEAEWEFAARGPQSLVYPWGNEFDINRANVVGYAGAKKVGSYPNGVSWVGAHDMAGNAMEWVLDWMSYDYYQLKVRDNPLGPQTGTSKIEKGGWWDSYAFVARGAYRHFEDPPEYQDHHIGARIVSLK